MHADDPNAGRSPVYHHGMSPRDNNIEASARAADAHISYLADGSYINRRFVAPGAEVNTGVYETHAVKVRDGRPISDHFTLDDHGFVLATRPSSVGDFYDNDEVEATYVAEAEAAIASLTGADKVVSRGWMCRNSGELEARQVENYQHNGGIQPPAAEAHVDFTRESAKAVADATYAERFPDAPPYRRFLFTSLWRSFSPPPQDWPLAVCDGSSVGRDEGTANALVVVDEIPDRETMLGDLEPGQALITADVFRYNPDHRWWYFSNMTRDEVILLKFYDSDESRVHRTPHTAFRDRSFDNPNVRESIELRSVAFFL